MPMSKEDREWVEIYNRNNEACVFPDKASRRLLRIIDSLQKQVEDIQSARKFIESQVDLDAESKEVLYKNMWDLYT